METLENKTKNDWPYQNYRCPVCGHLMVRGVAIFLTHTKAHILDLLRKHYPEWESSENSLECENYFERQLHGWKTKEEPDHDQKSERPA